MAFYLARRWQSTASRAEQTSTRQRPEVTRNSNLTPLAQQELASTSKAPWPDRLRTGVVPQPHPV